MTQAQRPTQAPSLQEVQASLLVPSANHVHGIPFHESITMPRSILDPSDLDLAKHLLEAPAADALGALDGQAQRARPYPLQAHCMAQQQ